jgi:dihydrofolate reductase
MGKLVLFMHVSLDGFTARSNGSMDWIQISDEMFEYATKRTEESDTALYGRKTYEIMEAYWPTAADHPQATKHDIQHSGWYNKVNKFVVSETMRGQNIKNVQIISDHIVARIAELKQQVPGVIIMFGSPGLGSSLMHENLIDDYWFFVNPIILGEGHSLFAGNKNEVKLKLVKNIAFPNGVICLHYSKA